MILFCLFDGVGSACVFVCCEVEELLEQLMTAHKENKESLASVKKAPLTPYEPLYKAECCCESDLWWLY